MFVKKKHRPHGVRERCEEKWGGYAEVAVMVVRMCRLLHSSVGGAERGIVDEEGSTTFLVHDEQANGLG